MIEEKEVNFVRSSDAWVAHILTGLRDPFEACLSDARRELPSSKGDVQSCLAEEQGERVEEESVVIEEVARNKEVVSKPIKTQGAILEETGHEDQPHDSNDGPIKEYMVASATKRTRNEFEEDEEATLSIRKKQKVSQGPEQTIKPKTLPRMKSRQMQREQTILSPPLPQRR